MGQLTGCFSPNDHWCWIASNVTGGKSEVAALNSVMRAPGGGKLEDELQEFKEINCFFFKERLNVNMNLVVEFSVVTFEHVL